MMRNGLNERENNINQGLNFSRYGFMLIGRSITVQRLQSVKGSEKDFQALWDKVKFTEGI